MALTAEQQEFLTTNYVSTHLRDGQTATAADAANTRLKLVDTGDFTNMSVAEWHGELAAQAVVLSRSAVQKTDDLAEKMRLLEQAGTVILQHYPVNSNLLEVTLRNEYWIPVFGDLNAHMRCLRDYIHFLTDLKSTNLSHEKATRVQAMLFHLNSIAEYQTPESGKRILQIENGDRMQATRAFLQFLRHHGIYSLRHNRPELIAVTKKFGKKLKQGKVQPPEQPDITIDEQLIEQFFSIAYIGMGKSIYSIL